MMSRVAAMAGSALIVRAKGQAVHLRHLQIQQRENRKDVPAAAAARRYFRASTPFGALLFCIFHARI